MIKFFIYYAAIGLFMYLVHVLVGLILLAIKKRKELLEVLGTLAVVLAIDLTITTIAWPYILYKKVVK